MTIRLRVMSEGNTSEYRFNRARITLGRGPANDLVISSSTVALRHGTLSLLEDQLIFEVERATAPTMLLRDGELIEELEVDQTGRLSLVPGDFLVLGGRARVEILDVRLVSALAPLETMPRAARLESGAASATLAQAYLLASERVTAAGSELARALPTLGRFASLALAITSCRALLTIFTSRDEFLDDTWAIELDTARVEPDTEQEELALLSRGPLSRLDAERSVQARALLDRGDQLVIDPVRVGKTACAIHMPLRSDAQVLGVLTLELDEPLDDAQRARLPHIWRALNTLATPMILVRQLEARVRSLNEEQRYSRERERRRYLFKSLICESEAMRQVYRQLNALVASPEPALIHGEAGSGKELLARALHHLGPRTEGRLIRVHCESLSDEVMGVELFGCVASELAGAVAARQGIFELAHGGTVYMEKIEALSPVLQSKLVRMLKEGEVRRVGDSVGRRVSARLVVSTDRELGELARSGAIRHDLYLLLRDTVLSVPPLRERHEDLMPLAHQFLRQCARRHNRRVTSFDEEVIARMTRYDWPGNVRELQTFVEAATIRCAPDAEQITLRELMFDDAP